MAKTIDPSAAKILFIKNFVEAAVRRSTNPQLVILALGSITKTLDNVNRVCRRLR